MSNDFSKDLNPAQSRDSSIDIIRGISILLVVYAHTCPFCRNFLYLFVLTIFLVTSGYCFKNRIQNWADWRHYMAGKLRTLYIPCAVCNGIYALLGGVFLRLGFYTDNPEFLTMTEEWPVPQKLYLVRSCEETLQKFCRVILLTDTTQMGTATWFLIMLFAISAFHGTACCLTAKWEPRKRQMAGVALFLLMAALAKFADLPYDAWMYPRCFFYSYLTYLLGIGIRNSKLEFLESPVGAVSGFVVLIFLSRRYFFDLANAEIASVLPYLAGVLGGWCMMKYTANRIALHKSLSKVFCYPGRHTIPIICLHVLCFKPVTWLFIRIHHLPVIYLASFHVEFDASEPWKLLYFAAGTAFPLLLDTLWRRHRLLPRRQ